MVGCQEIMTAGNSERGAVMSSDERTAAAFATSWNALPSGSVYTREQFEEWMEPVTENDVRGHDVLELGCGNASLLVHMTGWSPSRLEGVDLGDSVVSARSNMAATGFRDWSIAQADLTAFTSSRFDLVYCIGVLHHLAEPRKGLDAVIRNTKPGGRFHCWVYAWEGNAVVRHLVEPLRRLCSRLPWWFTKFFVATPLALPYFLYAKCLARLPKRNLLERLPLYAYSLWIARRGFGFFRHVAFDQLVTPRTVYLRKEIIDEWIRGYECIEPGSTYLILRNGNSWKFGGKIACRTPTA